MANDIVLRPSYWASVSGGKDSLLMLKLILENPDKYPLDGVVHFELEIDFPFIHNVIDYMEKQCTDRGIKFLRIKPRKSWYDLYNEFGFPTRKARWCNSQYKLDALYQLKAFLKEQGCYVVSYIGYCLDETGRYEKRGENVNEIYPLVIEGITEDRVHEWAKTVTLFNNYYKTQFRCGCMYCPLASNINLAYMLKYYPAEYAKYIDMIRATEQRREKELGRPFAVRQSNPKYNADYTDNIIRTKWLKKLEEMEAKQ